MKAAACVRQPGPETQCAGSQQPEYRDFALADLCPELRESLENFSFPSLLGSFDYCRWFSHPPVERAACLAEPNGQIREALFYNERRWATVYKQLELVGHAETGAEALRALLRERMPDLLTLSLQTVAEFPARIDEWKLLDVRTTSEDYRFELPASADEYLRQIGRQARKHFPYYLRRLQREWAGHLSFRTDVGEQISSESFEQILDLSRQRINNKGRRCLWTKELVAHRWPLVRKRGLVVGAFRDDLLVGGTVSLLHGPEAYLMVVAHDPRYDTLNLGNVCLWKTILWLIEAQYAVFHLLWGNAFYKEQFGGRRLPIRAATYGSAAAPSRLWGLSRRLRIAEVLSLARRAALRLRDCALTGRAALPRGAR